MARKHVSVAEFKAAMEAGAKPEEMIVTKSIVMTKAEEGEQMLRVRTFEVSNESVDRDGDIVKQSGVDWKNFMKNPVVLFAHNSKELPIGKGLQVRRVGTKTLMDIEFAAADANPKADQVLKLLDGGFLNAGSIGFVPLEAARVDTKGRTGFDITKAEALEFSIVPVPANPDALVQAKEAGLDVAVMKDFLADALKGFRLNEAGEIEAIPAPAPKVEKGMYEVGELARVLGSLGYIEDCAEREREWEGDESQVPEMLTAAMRQLGAALIAMTQEEVAELIGEESGEGMKAAKSFLANVKVKAKAKAPVVIHNGEFIVSTAEAEKVKEAVKKAMATKPAAKEVNDTAQTGNAGLVAAVMAALKKVLPGATAGGVNDTVDNTSDANAEPVGGKSAANEPVSEAAEAEAKALAALAVSKSRKLIATA